MIETLQIFIEAPIELRTIILACLIMGIYWHFKKDKTNKTYLLYGFRYGDINECIKFNTLKEIKVALIDRYSQELDDEDIKKIKKWNAYQLANQFECEIKEGKKIQIYI